MLLCIKQYRLRTFFKYAADILYLMLPILLAQVAQMGISLTDTIMAGAKGTDDLAAVALGSSLFVTIYITLMGVLMSISPILSHHFGALKGKSCASLGQIGQQGLWFGLILGILGMVIMQMGMHFFAQYFLLSVGAKQMMIDYIFYASFAMPAAMVYRALYFYALSLERPLAITIISVICFFINILLNYVFVYGKFGAPALGGAGCGIATMIVFWLHMIFMVVYLKYCRYFAPFGLFTRMQKPDFSRLKQFIKLGAPIGFSFFIEVSLFTFIMFLVARLPENTTLLVAAQQVAISITSFLFIIPLSIGMVCTAKVGYYLGQQKFAKARYSSEVAIVLSMMIAAIMSAMLVLFRQPIAAAFTQDLAVIAMVVKIVLFVAAYQMVDAVQCVASYALRGYKITRLPMLVHIITFWGAGLLLGYYLAYVQNLSIYGFWWALVVSLSLAAVLLLAILLYYGQKSVIQKRQKIV